jgi:hypothetical protein
MASNAPAVLEYGQGDTWQVGGSRFALFSNYAFNPIGFGPTLQQVPYALPSVPPVYGQGGPSTNDSAGTMQAAAVAGANPLHPKWSPLPWVLGGAFVAVLGLHFLHWSDREPEERREEAA